MTPAVASDPATRIAASAVERVSPEYYPIFEAEQLIDLVGSSLVAASRGERSDALLDGYLCAASLCQVVSDHLHRDVGDLGRIARYASRLPRPVGGTAVRGLAGAARARRWFASPRESSLSRWLTQVEDLTGGLASILWGEGGEDDVDTLVLRWVESASLPSGFPRSAIAIPPRCFFSFDQRPEDCIELARRFASRRQSDNRRVLVVGVRTSGCFMAPIVAAGLRGTGLGQVDWMSWRPGQPVLAADRAMLRQAIAAGVQAVVIDDPPTSGGSLARVASELAREGFPTERITLLVPTLSRTGEWEERLRRWETVPLEWPDWHVERQLRETAVAAALGRLFPDARVEHVTRLSVGDGHHELPPPNRKHVRALYRVGLEEPGGFTMEREIFVHGVGLGIFGARLASMGRRLGGLVPEIYGLVDGLMFRDWISDAQRIDEGDPATTEKLAAGVARYAARRASVLQVPEDASISRSGHDALWEQASRWLGAGFGRAALPLRPLLHSASRHLLRAGRTSLIDGEMGPGRWFEREGALVKTGWDEGAFIYQIPFTYDAAYDVASAAAQRLPDTRFGAAIRAEFEAITGAPIEDWRWFLYEVLSQLDRRAQTLRRQSNPLTRQAIVEALTDGERRIAGLHRGFLCELHLRDIQPSSSGPVCAVDVDGVLEDARAGYSAPSESGLLALRGLARHGFRTVIATGRSLAETVQRCRDYRLAGGVAEYGSVVYDAIAHRFDVLLDASAAANLEMLRHALQGLDGVELDPAFGYSVRAFAFHEGRRRAIPTDVAEKIISAAGLDGQVRIIQGWAQTDFTARGVDKATGLTALLGRFGLDPRTELALAVGDSLSDAPMLELAQIAVTTANADPRLGLVARNRRTRWRYGAGLGEAVEMLIRHAPGGCPACAPQQSLDAPTELLLALLRVGEVQGLRKLPAIARVARINGRRRL